MTAWWQSNSTATTFARLEMLATTGDDIFLNLSQFVVFHPCVAVFVVVVVVVVVSFANECALRRKLC